MISFLLLTSSLLLLAQGEAARMKKIDLTERDEGALCADLSPAVYYWKESENPETRLGRTWIVYLGGESFCQGNGSCASLYENPYASSTDQPDEKDFDGIFAYNEASPYNNANRAYLHYCSADLYLGDRAYESADDDGHPKGFYG